MAYGSAGRNNARKERFPYLLTGTKPKWGSGIPTLNFLEKDGKGILITTPKRQLYFRAEQTLLERGLIVIKSGLAPRILCLVSVKLL